MPTRYLLARALQVMGLGVILAGLAVSVSLGIQDQGLSSMKYELFALTGGGAVFYLGRWIQGGNRGGA